ncbi:hypothetical protein E2P81_ATG06990 [Venturia nashicola]|uniref:Mediator of RNA polymerase II transcription subunit 9 n=1 Tax=Venturia nashicola TaxID=86259 RepID=A0A4Z1P126_9PEZI|nr:hypothetical protein E6O75_ATG07156 [Venturia nashicola]TLD19373.1 hypothetical protein E2P81_ATG06990 [Venturia nashicola]
MATPAMHSRQTSTTAHTPVLASTEPDPLPPPETFDFLPLLHVLLRRISVPSGAPLPNLDGTGGGEGAEATSSADSSDKVWDLKNHLDIKNLGSAVSHVKVRMQRARVAVRSMPDIERRVEEQEEEMRELERVIERQRSVLTGLGHGQGEAVSGEKMDED